MGPVATLTLKDLRLLLRDKPGFFFTFAFPLLYATFFGTIMSGMSGGGSGSGPASAIKVLVVDEDRTEHSAAFVQAIDDSADIDAERVDSADKARARVATGSRTAAVIVPKGYGEATDRLFWGEPRRLQLLYDPSRSAERGMLQGILTGLSFGPFQDMFQDPARTGKLAQDLIENVRDSPDMEPGQRDSLIKSMQYLQQFSNEMPRNSGGGDGKGEEGGGGFRPIEIESLAVAGKRNDDKPGRNVNPYSITFPQATIWGIMGAAASFGISLVTERSRGTLTRLRCAPITRHQVLLGKSGACFITTMAVATVLFILAAVAFNVRPGWASVPKLAMALASVSICFVGIMMLLSVVGKTEAAAGGIGWAVLIVLAMFGGGMIPLMFLDGWMQTASNFSPVKWSILAMEGAVWRGFDFGQMMRPCLILIGIGIVGFFAGAQIFRRVDAS